MKNRSYSNGNRGSMNSANKMFDGMVAIFKFFGDCFLEFIWALKTKTVPIFQISLATLFFTVSFYHRWDELFWKKISLDGFMPPENLTLLLWYWIFVAWLMPVICWIMYRVWLRNDFKKKLTDLFLSCGVHSLLNKLPGFISDKPIGDTTRQMRLLSNGLPKRLFEENKEYLASGLKAEIEHIKEDVYKGTVDIIYATKPLPTEFQYTTAHEMGDNMRFTIGQGRDGLAKFDFKKTPHILVAGTTGYGKSTFVRQMVTTLLLNNKHNIEIDFIDLKFGAEASIFKEYEGVTSIKTAYDAIRELRISAERIKDLGELMACNSVQNIEQLRKIPKSKIKYPNEQSKKLSFNRKLIVIDEAGMLFTLNSQTNTSQASEARRIVANLTTLGRSAGVHVAVCTQRPSAKVVDMEIKGNTHCRVCFSMSDNASSMTILDNARAAKVGDHPGRAVWQNGRHKQVVQVPHLSSDHAVKLLEVLAKKPPEDDKKKTDKNKQEEKVY